MSATTIAATLYREPSVWMTTTAPATNETASTAPHPMT